MTDIADKIVENTLDELGVVSKDTTPKPAETPKVSAKPIKAKPLDDLDIPDFLDRRKKADNRDKVYVPKTGRAASPADWKHDSVIAKLDELRQTSFECLQGTSDAVIEEKALDNIVYLLATDVANAMEHAGLVYMGEGSPSRLRDLLRSFIVADTKHNNGSMYRYVTVAFNKTN